jgi:hypothetical protein
MAIHSGTQGSVVYTTSNGTAGTLIGGMKTWSLSIEGEVLDTSAFGQSWRSKDIGIKQWTGSFEGNKDGGNVPQNNVWAQLLAGSKAEVTFYMGTVHRYYGTVVITGEEIAQTFDGFAETSYSFEGDGTLVKGTV